MRRSNAVLQPEAVGGGDDFIIAVQRGSSVLGLARGKSRSLASVRARIDLEGFGQIDFIPTNRDALVILPTLTEGGNLSPLPVDGVYSVVKNSEGIDKIHGIEGATGWVAMRLAMRDKTLPVALRDVVLAELTDAVSRSVHVANVPVPLGQVDRRAQALVELVCVDANGAPQSLVPGSTTSVAYTDRDSCRLVLHGESLRPEDGEQLLRLTVTTIGPDGVVHTEAQMDQQLRLAFGQRSHGLVFCRPWPIPLPAWWCG